MTSTALLTVASYTVPRSTKHKGPRLPPVASAGLARSAGQSFCGTRMSDFSSGWDKSRGLAGNAKRRRTTTLSWTKAVVRSTQCLGFHPSQSIPSKSFPRRMGARALPGRRFPSPASSRALRMVEGVLGHGVFRVKGSQKGVAATKPRAPEWRAARRDCCAAGQIHVLAISLQGRRRIHDRSDGSSNRRTAPKRASGPGALGWRSRGSRGA